MGHADGFAKLGSEKNLLPSYPAYRLDDGEEVDDRLEVLHTASFEELASKNVQYNMIIWVLISLLLVLAWGIGIIMLLYLPYRRYVLQKDIESRKLYITSKEIVYQVTRPSFIPFLGEIKIQKHVPLYLIIDIIIEQGCLQSVYGLHTFRVESIAHRKAAPVDELHVQGVSNPWLLRKVIVTHASKATLESTKIWNPSFHISGGESMSRMESLTLGPAVLRSPTPHKSWKKLGSPHTAFDEPRGAMPADLMLHKLEEVNKSIKKIEFFFEKSQGPMGVGNAGEDGATSEENFETPRVQL
ncbi:uncharacterized protein LOC127266173 [Andrographis paniculata]|uniref:uncharacterized protein LOC127266173 n=1 Tax=Andrographis paniculata TaxID=175694 RepID=UPI0021E7A3FC|nr:uncharacterized protein LOC127266173 [Andrographis paniculata]XP_051152295.1 uncharacterized protein LOC127266173 [Andrographis paniculata]